MKFFDKWFLVFLIFGAPITIIGLVLTTINSLDISSYIVFFAGLIICVCCSGCLVEGIENQAAEVE